MLCEQRRARRRREQIGRAADSPSRSRRTIQRADKVLVDGEDRDYRRHREHQRDAERERGTGAVEVSEHDDRNFGQDQQQHRKARNAVANREADLRRLLATVRAPAQHFERVLEERRPDQQVEDESDRDMRNQVRHRERDVRRQRAGLHRIEEYLEPALAVGASLFPGGGSDRHCGGSFGTMCRSPSIAKGRS
jgi:hypothetical protein